VLFFVFGLVYGNHVFYDHQPVCDGLVKKKRKKKSLSVMSVNGRTKDHPPAVFECWRRPFIRRRNQDHRQHIDRPAIMPFQTPPALTEVRKKISQIYFGR
jgi:hypothetical protein